MIFTDRNIALIFNQRAHRAHREKIYYIAKNFERLFKLVHRAHREKIYFIAKNFAH